MPLFRTVSDTKGFIPNGFYPERCLIGTVLIPKGRFSEIRNKTFRIKTVRIKNFMMSKNSPKLKVTRRGQIKQDYESERLFLRMVFIPKGFYSEFSE